MNLDRVLRQLPPDWHERSKNSPHVSARAAAASLSVLTGRHTEADAKNIFSVTNTAYERACEAVEHEPGKVNDLISGRLSVYTLHKRRTKNVSQRGVSQERFDRLTNAFLGLGVGKIKIRSSSAEDADSRFDCEVQMQKIHIDQLERLARLMKGRT